MSVEVMKKNKRYGTAHQTIKKMLRYKRYCLGETLCNDMENEIRFFTSKSSSGGIRGAQCRVRTESTPRRKAEYTCRVMQRMGSNSANGYARWRTNINSPTAAPEKGGGPFMNTSSAGTIPVPIAEARSAETTGSESPSPGPEPLALAASEPEAIPAPTKPDAADPAEEDTPAIGSSTTPPPAGGGDGPEENEEGDAVESLIRTLKGMRPELLRTVTYYAGAKVCQ